MFDKVRGYCRIRESEVEILFVKLKKAKAKAGARTPIRCQSSAECTQSSFCKFVNPLANHLPVDFSTAPGAAEAS